MSNVYAIKDSANVTIIKKSDSKPFLYADYATQSTNEWKQASVYAMSKSERAVRFDHSKESTLKMELEIFDLKWLSMLAGSDFVTGATEILKREVLTASATNTITLTGTPKTGSLTVFLLDPDGKTHLAEQELGTPASNPNEYSIAGSVITLNTTTAPEGTELVVYYLKDSEATAKKLEIKANAFPFAVEIYADTEIRDTDDTDKFVQVHYLNAKALGDYTITMSAKDITKLSVTFDLLKDSKSDLMATYTIIE